MIARYPTMTDPFLLGETEQPQMAAPEVQHPMHTMLAPILPKPPEIDPMVAYESMQAAKPASMSADSSQLGGENQPGKIERMSPVDPYEQRLRAKQMSDLEKDENPYGSADNHPGFFGKLLHGLSVATGGPNRRLASEAARQGQIDELEKEKGAQGLQQAQTEAQQSEVPLHEAQASAAELIPATQAEADAFGVPLGTPLNAALRGALAKQAGINATKITTTHETNDTKRDVAGIQALSRETIAQLKPQQRDDRAIAINQKLAEGQPITQEEGAYLKAYGKYINDTKIQPGVARAAAFGAFRPVQILGPNGDVEYQYSGQAIRSGAATPQSMNFRTAAGMAKFMTSGKGGQTITAYNTANDHLELLGKAMDALQNGDVQALNQLNNSFKQQFGSAAPTNVNAVKAMLAGELANVAKVTGATDMEIKEQKDNINRASSPEQIRGFIDTNHDLMDQKAYEMYQQYQQGMQGQPAFTTGLSGHQPANGAGGGSAPKIKKFNPQTGRLE
jgi:hypothetical protein